MAVSYPWVFQEGNRTARTLATSTVTGILSKAGYGMVSPDRARLAWTRARLPEPKMGKMPSLFALAKFGRALKVKKVVYGSVSWHTRSIWVNLGPKTVSTATVNVRVYDVATGRVYSRSGVRGRSDEKSNGYKVAAAILLTPLVTALTGGAATPREQRAAQIALGRSLRDWIRAIPATR